MAGECSRFGSRLRTWQGGRSRSVKEARPDVVIVATGATRPIIPPINGIDRVNAVTPKQVLAGETAVGQDVVVLGGNFIGVETAIAMATKGRAKSVTVIEPWPVPALGYDMSTLNRTYVSFVMLPKYGVRGFVGMQIDEVSTTENHRSRPGWKAAADQG